MTQSRSAGKAAFAFVFVTVLLDMLALGIMAPVLPKLVIQFEGGNIATAAEITGVFGFSWAAMQFFFSPFLGALSDRFGRRGVILLSNFGLGVDYLFMAVSPNVWWLFVGRVVSGITSSSFSTAAAYIADVTEPEKRAAKFGLLGAAFGLGFIIGPAAGGLLGEISLRLPFWVAAGLSLANAAYGYFVLPESLPIDKRAKFSWKVANPIGSLNLFLSKRGLLGLAMAVFLYALAHESLPSIFVLYTDYRYRWDSRMVGISLAAIGISTTIVSAMLVERAVSKLGERGALLIGLLFGVLGFAIYGYAPTTAVFLAGIPLIGLMGIAGPAMQALMTKKVGVSEQGQLQGAISSVRGITGMIGPLIYTQALSAAIGATRSFLVPGFPYYLAAITLFGSLILAWQVAQRS